MGSREPRRGRHDIIHPIAYVHTHGHAATGALRDASKGERVITHIDDK